MNQVMFILSSIYLQKIEYHNSKNDFNVQMFLKAPPQYFERF